MAVALWMKSYPHNEAKRHPPFCETTLQNRHAAVITAYGVPFFSRNQGADNTKLKKLAKFSCVKEKDTTCKE
jgi:hypothetical protein